MRSLFAQIDATDNGYVVKYPEAIMQKRPLPNPIDQIPQAQIDFFLTMMDAGDEGDEGWKGDGEKRSDKVRKKLDELRAKHEGRCIEVWVLVEREFIAVGFEGVTEALKSAASAREAIRKLQEQGHQLLGGAGILAVVPGAPIG